MKYLPAILFFFLIGCNEYEPVPVLDQDVLTRSTSSCDTTVHFEIMGSTHYNENLIVFQDGVLDTSYYPVFGTLYNVGNKHTDTLSLNLSSFCGQQVRFHRGYVFNPVHTSFDKLFTHYNLEYDTIRTVQDSLVFGMYGYHILKIRVEQLGAANIVIRFNEYVITFEATNGDVEYTLLFKMTSPYYKNLEISSSGKSTIKNFQLKNFILYGKLLEIDL